MVVSKLRKSTWLSVTHGPGAKADARARLIVRLACLMLAVTGGLFWSANAGPAILGLEVGIADLELATITEKIRRDPLDASARLRLANLYLSRGRSDEALAEAEKALQTGAGDDYMLLTVGTAFLQAGREVEAIALLGRIGHRPSSSRLSVDSAVESNTHLALGRAYLRAGMTSQAVEHLRRAAQKSSLDLSPYLVLGDAHLAHGDVAEAIADFEQVLEVLPTCAAGYAGLARAYRLQGNEEMRSWAEAMVQSSNGQLLEAEATLKTVRPRLRDTVVVHLGLASLYEALNEPERALMEYQAVLLLDPNSLIAQQGVQATSQLRGK